MNLNETIGEIIKSLFGINKAEPRTSVKIGYIFVHIIILYFMLLILIITTKTSELMFKTILESTNLDLISIAIFITYFVLTSVVYFIYKKLNKLKLAHKKVGFLTSLTILSTIVIFFIFTIELFF